MSIEVVCDGCNKKYQVKEELAGRRVKCKSCGETMRIPDADTYEDDVLEEDDDEDDDDESDKEQRSRTKRSGKKKSRGPEKSTLGEVFGNATILMKMLVGAFATPILLVAMMAKANRRAGKPLDFTDPMMIVGVIAAIPVGAVLGALLTVKDVVQERVARKAHVPFPLLMLFGKGILSALLWIPFVIVVVLIVTIATF